MIRDAGAASGTWVAACGVDGVGFGRQGGDGARATGALLHPPVPAGVSAEAAGRIALPGQRARRAEIRRATRREQAAVAAHILARRRLGAS